jgi:hypothetical protein
LHFVKPGATVAPQLVQNLFSIGMAAEAIVVVAGLVVFVVGVVVLVVGVLVVPKVEVVPIELPIIEGPKLDGDVNAGVGV